VTRSHHLSSKAFEYDDGKTVDIEVPVGNEASAHSDGPTRLATPLQSEIHIFYERIIGLPKSRYSWKWMTDRIEATMSFKLIRSGWRGFVKARIPDTQLEAKAKDTGSRYQVQINEIS
jgi:hypothetical protein